MKVTEIDVVEATIPFRDGGDGIGLTPGRWDRLDSLFVRVRDEEGHVGWGECFSYVCRSAVTAAVVEMVAPLVLGASIEDPAAFGETLQRRLHTFGRYGVALFAISGMEMALWDLMGRRTGTSVARLLGTPRRRTVDAYASLVRYDIPELVERKAAEAVATGFRSIKLHEVRPAVIAAGRRGAGADVHLTVDVNCAFDLAGAAAMLQVLQANRVAWFEEPVFPPEDAISMAELRRAAGSVAVAGGENWCTRHQFEAMVGAGAVDVLQPSATKIGGLGEFRSVMHLAETAGLTLMPHSPYFGPGWFATLQMVALAERDPLVEWLWVEPEAMPSRRTPSPVGGTVAIPDGPGLGFEMDPRVLETHGRRVAHLE